MTTIRAVRTHIPLIQFRAGLAMRPKEAPQPTPAAAAIPAAPVAAAAAAGQAFPNITIPSDFPSSLSWDRLRRILPSDEEIEAINTGGAM